MLSCEAHLVQRARLSRHYSALRLGHSQLSEDYITRRRSGGTSKPATRRPSRPSRTPTRRPRPRILSTYIERIFM
jgi:hypothetical protein